MAEQTLDFWPDIAASYPKATPLSLMKQQAVLLGQHTGNVLEARVETSTYMSELVHKFNIAAPTLSYEYELFRIRHKAADLYPVTVLV